jgi:hypothetical protein
MSEMTLVSTSNKSMKKFLVLALSLCCATSITLRAAEGKKEVSEEQKKAKKELLDKYDANKDGKLDKEERAKISEEDKAKLKAAGLGGGRKKQQ